MKKLTDNFSLDELIFSATAIRHGIDNTPNEEEEANLKRLATDILQPIRNKWNDSIIVNSGYRCRKLNNKVGGATNSQHLYGEATDIESATRSVYDNKKLFDLIVDMINNNEIEVGQLIDEYNYNWLHISLPTDRHKNQILHLPH